MSAIFKPENVPQFLRELPPSYLMWRYESRPGDKKPRKVPHWVDGSRRSGTQGSPEDRARLAAFDVAVKACEAQQMTGIGLAMLPENGIIAGDFDNCVDDGIVHPGVLQLVHGTYAEFSPSRNGVRAFWTGTIDGNPKSPTSANEFGFELFHSKGFVTITGDILSGGAA
jgi:primase-polymerase (primpol)-like protein